MTRPQFSFRKILTKATAALIFVAVTCGLASMAVATLYTCNLACSNAAGGGGIYLGRTYDIIFTTQAFNQTTSPAYDLQTTAWWGNSSLARGLATVVGNPPGGGDPDFAYRLQSNLTSIDYYHYSEGSARNASESITFNTMFAFGTEVTAPEIDGATLPKAALLLFSLYLLRFSRQIPLSSISRID